MEERETAARPYGLAAFKQALEEDKLHEWRSMLELLAAIARDPTMQGIIAHHDVSDDQVAKLILDIAGERLSDTGRNFVRVLAANDRLNLLVPVFDVFTEELDKHEGRSKVEVTSAFELDDQQREAIADAMSKRLGTKVDLSVSVDDSLIGGAIIRAGDLVIDGSIRGQLHQLGQALR